ncbi:nuclear transport factor 2 family protein [uncultured Kordia sp.]|uniref:nuclear transport factor 2 family protein n=1 Tax=uncultured Kordia sp. TaxID=507699 RepID=UPI002630A3F6|nr:nuclear transport factor 2 family protein [uncultured Kordia sp.]
MNFLKVISFTIMITFFINSCSKKATYSQNSVKDKQTLRHIKEVLWAKAYREQDTVLLDQILDESFEFIDGSGNRFTKKDELHWIKNNATKHDSFHYEIKRLDIYKNGTAIISGTGHIYKDSIYSFYQSSNVLIKKDTIWKAISSHVSGYRQLK